MKFYKNGRIIKFKKSKKTVELEPTYYESDSTNSSVKDSWEYRRRKYEQIEKDQEQEDDLKTLEHSADYVGERMSVSLGGMVGLGIINLASYIAYHKFGIDALANSGITFGSVTDLALTAGILTGFGTLNIKTISEFTKDALTLKKLKSIKNEIEQEKFEKEDKIKKEVQAEKEQEEAEKYALLHRKENPTKVIEYEVVHLDVDEDGKVVERIEKLTTNHSPRYEDYKKHVLSTGGDEKLFELPAINNIIDYVIEYADGRVKMEGRSPIYYKNSNEDGTFDICGRMSGPTVTLVYKMEYCNDDNPDHYIVLKKYEQRRRNECTTIHIEGCYHNKIYINKDGQIVEETEEIKIPGFERPQFFSDLQSKKLVKSMI